MKQCGILSLLLVCCLGTAVALDHGCFQEGRTKWVGSSIEDQHVFELLYSISVSIRPMKPSEMSTMCDPKFEGHGAMFLMQSFKNCCPVF